MLENITIKRREYEEGRFTLDLYVDGKLWVSAISKERLLDTILPRLLHKYRAYTELAEYTAVKAEFMKG